MSVELTPSATLKLEQLLQSENRLKPDTYIRITHHTNMPMHRPRANGNMYPKVPIPMTYGLMFESTYDPEKDWLFNKGGMKFIVDKALNQDVFNGLKIGYEDVRGFEFARVGTTHFGACNTNSPKPSCGCSDNAIGSPLGELDPAPTGVEVAGVNSTCGMGGCGCGSR